ncbi:MAG: DUF1573 domain-containing protein [Spirochaetales bacterium]|nr:DUF1573 domain-containing protein [Spirochaetales bacterium]
MKFKYLFFLVSLACVYSFFSCDNRKDYDIQFEKEVYDFGQLNENTRTTLVFRYKNTGKNNLEVELIRATCGCTEMKEYDRVVKPGKWGEMPVDFNTEAMTGQVLRSVYIKTNVPGREDIRLDITGDVFNPVTVSPQSNWLGNVKKDTTELTANYVFSSNINMPVVFDRIEMSKDNVTYSLDKNEDETVVTLKLTIKPPFGEEQNQSGSFYVKLGGGFTREYHLGYSYIIETPIQVNPEIVELNMESLAKESYERRINIKSNIEAPIDIFDLKFDGENVKYSIEALLKDKFYQIPLIFPEGYLFPANKENLTLSFRVKNDPDNKLYKIVIKPYKK